MDKYQSRRLQEAYAFLSSLSDLEKGEAEGGNLIADPFSNQCGLVSLQEKTASDVPVGAHQTVHLSHSLSITSAINIENEVKRNQYLTEHTNRRSFSSTVFRSKSNVETNYDYNQDHIIKLENCHDRTFRHKKLSKRRLVLTTYSQIPLALLSVIPYEKQLYQESRSSVVVHQTHTHSNIARFIENIEYSADGKIEVSYSHLLQPQKRMRKNSESQGMLDDLNFSENESVLLDDPELISGKHRTVLNLPSLITSIIPYAKPAEVKADINGQFKERHPNVTITLTKLRSIKGELSQIASKINLDTVILVICYLFFEKVVLKTRVSKQNRKYIAGACMLLSIKFFDDVHSKNIKNVAEVICEQLRLNSKDLFLCELQVLILLEFSLIVSPQEI